MSSVSRAGAVIRLVPAVMLMLLALPLSLHAQETTDTTKLDAKLRATRAELNAAYTALDATKSSSYYTDDAVVEFGPEVFTGRPAIQQWLANALSGLSALRFGTPSFTVSPDNVIDRVPYSIVLPDGSTQSGSSTLTWKKQGDGSWKVTKHVVT